MNGKKCGVPCCIMRGGTSKGLFFYERDMPAPGAERDAFLLNVMGSPDARQIDGLGGADPLTSKVAIVAASVRAEADIDYTFAQVPVNGTAVDYGGNCGNITSAVGLFAVEEGLVDPAEPTAQVRIFNTNTGKLLRVEVPCRDGAPVREGDYQIDGVPGTGARLNLDFSHTQGAFSGRLFPTGSRMDRLDIPGFGPLEVSLVDIANPVAFVCAADVGLQGREQPQELTAGQKELLERIRGVAAERLGAASQWRSATAESPAMPMLALVSAPESQESNVSLVSRLMFMQVMHKAYSGTAAVCTAVAASIAGTVPYACAVRRSSGFLIAHPAGYMEVEVAVEETRREIRIETAAFGRTARRLMDGYVYLK